MHHLLHRPGPLNAGQPPAPPQRPPARRAQPDRARPAPPAGCVDANIYHLFSIYIHYIILIMFKIQVKKARRRWKCANLQ